MEGRQKKQIKFQDEVDDSLLQPSSSVLRDSRHKSSLSEVASPLKRSKSILVNRPSELTEYEQAEEEGQDITRENNIKHAEEDDNLIRCESVGTLGETDTKIFCVKFDEDDKYIAAACENGEVRVYNTKTEELVYQIANDTESSFSYLKWRPVKGMNKTKNVFVTTNADGLIQHWHLNSGKCLDTIQVDTKSENKQLNCLDFNHDASKFMVCGGDPVVSALYLISSSDSTMNRRRPVSRLSRARALPSGDTPTASSASSSPKMTPTWCFREDGTRRCSPGTCGRTKPTK